jgi:hypothetical protein
MPLDSQAKWVLEPLGRQGAKRNQLSIEEIRKNKGAQIPLAGHPEQVAKVIEQRIPVQGGTIKVRMYVPHGEGDYGTSESFDTLDGLDRRLSAHCFHFSGLCG